MESSNNNNTVSTVVNFTALLANTGINIDLSKVKAARRNLMKVGAANAYLTDDVAVAANVMTTSLMAADNSVKTACYIAGAMRIAETWKTQKDDNGKPYKSENAFLKGILPGYQTSTVQLYSDVGATIYIPAARGELDDLPGVADMGPSNAKFLLNSIKDASKRKALPSALSAAKEANNGKLSQRAIQSAIKSLNNTKTGAQDSQQSAGTIADELSGGAISKQLTSMISFAYNGDSNGDGDLTALVMEKDVKDFISLLLKARSDKDTALAVCEQLYTLAKKAK